MGLHIEAPRLTCIPVFFLGGGTLGLRACWFLYGLGVAMFQSLGLGASDFGLWVWGLGAYSRGLRAYLYIYIHIYIYIYIYTYIYIYFFFVWGGSLLE